MENGMKIQKNIYYKNKNIKFNNLKIYVINLV